MNPDVHPEWVWLCHNPGCDYLNREGRATGLCIRHEMDRHPNATGYAVPSGPAWRFLCFPHALDFEDDSDTARWVICAPESTVSCSLCSGIPNALPTAPTCPDCDRSAPVWTAREVAYDDLSPWEVLS